MNCLAQTLGIWGCEVAPFFIKGVLALREIKINHALRILLEEDRNHTLRPKPQS